MKVPITFFTIILFVFLCKFITKPQVIEVYDNPLDKVLGEKWDDKNCIRKANFSAILNKNEADLNRSSEVYSIKKIHSNYYFLRHKKKFEDSKTYSLIVKTKKNKIVDYTAINDYHLFNVLFHKEKLYYIADDFREGSIIERPNYGYVIGCLDKQLNNKWKLEQKTKILPFEASGLTIEKDTISVAINAIVGCSICYKIIQHRIALNGKVISLTDVGGNNSQAEIPINVMISNLQLKNLNKN